MEEDKNEASEASEAKAQDVLPATVLRFLPQKYLMQLGKQGQADRQTGRRFATVKFRFYRKM